MLLEKVIYGEDNLFHSRRYETNIFINATWHIHPEYELVYIIKGGGKRFVAERVDSIEDGALTLLGSNIPHFYISNDEYITRKDLEAKWHVLQFPKDIFPIGMDASKEFQHIQHLLTRSRFGLAFKDSPLKTKVLHLIDDINSHHGIHKVISLYMILDLLGQDKNAIQLLNYDYFKSITANKNEIVNKVYEYLVNNFQKNVTLQDIADYVCYNPSTLCSFFKKHTQFTIFDCLRDIRISFACKLLNNSAQNITQIAYESGYNNISHFNKQFIQQTSLTPSEYRKNMHNDNLKNEVVNENFVDQEV